MICQGDMSKRRGERRAKYTVFSLCDLRLKKACRAGVKIRPRLFRRLLFYSLLQLDPGLPLPGFDRGVFYKYVIRKARSEISVSF